MRPRSVLLVDHYIDKIQRDAALAEIVVTAV